MAAYLQVVLRESMKNLGKSGDLVRVRPGYARNYLVPRQLAVYATETNVARLEHEKREALARAAKVKSESEAIAKKLSGVTVTIARKVGADDRMYGSVTAKDIAAELAKAGHVVDKRQLELKEAIKTVGTHEVHARLSAEVSTAFKVEVTKASLSARPEKKHVRPVERKRSRGALHLGPWGEPRDPFLEKRAWLVGRS